MTKKSYAVGDMVMLRPSLFRAADSNRACKIVSILPADHGEVQYRVRFGDETHERRVVASDIEVSEKVADQRLGHASPERPAGGSWLKPASIRIRK
jgi:hypothetical protein